MKSYEVGDFDRKLLAALKNVIAKLNGLTGDNVAVFLLAADEYLALPVHVADDSKEFSPALIASYPEYAGQINGDYFIRNWANHYFNFALKVAKDILAGKDASAQVDFLNNVIRIYSEFNYGIFVRAARYSAGGKSLYSVAMSASNAQDIIRWYIIDSFEPHFEGKDGWEAWRDEWMPKFFATYIDSINGVGGLSAFDWLREFIGAAARDTAPISDVEKYISGSGIDLKKLILPGAAILAFIILS